MSKYLELFKGAFDDSIGAKTKPENKPYIGYSLTDGKLVYTVVPKPVTGPADNEIWYTTVDGVMLDLPFSLYKYENDMISGDLVYPIEHKKDGDVFKVVYADSLNDKGLGGGMTDGISTPSLKSILFPNVNISIDMQPFIDCRNLTKIVLPGKIENLGNQALFGTGLTSIILPSSLKYIGYQVFGFSNIENITFEGTTTEWNSIEKEVGWNVYNRFDDPETLIPATYVQCSDGQVAL